MNRAKFWTITISASAIMGLLVTGAHFASKDSTKESNRNERLARLQTLLDEGKAEYRPSLFRKKIKAAVEHVAGLDDSSTVTAIAPLKADEKKDEKKVAKKDDKKKDAKKDKKKKKKKKKIKGTGEPETAQPDDSSDEDADDSSDDVAAAPAGAGNNTPPVAGPNALNTNPQTADEWFAYLQANLDYDHVSKFIQLTQTGEVKAEVFYETVEKMLLDPGLRMHQFAVLALGSTPSQSSFTLLAAVSLEDSMEAKVKSQAQTYMRMYTRLEYVRHLGTVIAMENEIDASLTALALVQDSALLHLKNIATTPAPTETGSGTPTNEPPVQQPARTPASNITKTFDAIVASLQKVSTTSPNETLRIQAASTLQTLRSLLSQAS
jgi:Ribosome receptor lysine/proline rich region